MLRESKGNMYEFITHQWNPIRGECLHNCSYCYMKKYGNLTPIHLDEKYLKDDLGKDNFIFVCSGCDMFANNINIEWIESVINTCKNYADNKYLFQTKNPINIKDYWLPDGSIVCTTIESNRWYPEIMNNAPHPGERWNGLHQLGYDKYVTIEPILDFDLDEFINMFRYYYNMDSDIKQINIGADSKGYNLPEPSKEKILELISELQKFTKVHFKKNLNRLLKC